jgi:hypothetical protein
MENQPGSGDEDATNIDTQAVFRQWICFISSARNRIGAKLDTAAWLG